MRTPHKTSEFTHLLLETAGGLVERWALLYRRAPLCSQGLEWGKPSCTQGLKVLREKVKPELSLGGT